MTSGSSPFSASNPIKVMVVDDSAVVRHILVDILKSDPGIEVIGTEGVTLRVKKIS